MKQRINCKECNNEITTGSRSGRITQRIRLKFANKPYWDLCSRKCLDKTLNRVHDQRDMEEEFWV